MHKQKNDISAANEDFLKLIELMRARDPILNKAQAEAAAAAAAADTLSVLSKDGKETSRSKSGRSTLLKN